MLTRLYVDGFKNLRGTEIRFGPLTCIAGANGVGKSNVFDAIRFLSGLSDRSLMEAASGVRGGERLENLFGRDGDSRMVLECDMLIPVTGVDEFNQPAEATDTWLTYRLVLRLVEEDGAPRLRLEEERLEALPTTNAHRRLGYSYSEDWWRSVLRRSKRRIPYIAPAPEDATRVRLSADRMPQAEDARRGGGKPQDFLAAKLPRTVLSAAQNAEETRTVVLARREMRGWRLLQLEPSALRRPDELHAPAVLSPDGQHLPATLHRLAQDPRVLAGRPAGVLEAELANRLAELVEDVRAVRVERDEVRQVLQLVMEDRGGVVLPAASLSDGTLRFIALAALERDPEGEGILCLEEPENGIHPGRIGAMLQLLRDIAVDPEEPVDEANPLRQVIVSTHSPLVARGVRGDELVLASRQDVQRDGGRLATGLVFRGLERTWRASQWQDGAPVEVVALPTLCAYLESDGDAEPDGEEVPASVVGLTVRKHVEQLTLGLGAAE